MQRLNTNQASNRANKWRVREDTYSLDNLEADTLKMSVWLNLSTRLTRDWPNAVERLSIIDAVSIGLSVFPSNFRLSFECLVWCCFKRYLCSEFVFWLFPHGCYRKVKIGAEQCTYILVIIMIMKLHAINWTNWLTIKSNIPLLITPRHQLKHSSSTIS